MTHCTLLAQERDIEAIFWPDSGDGLQVGKMDCESLTVVHVAGQGGYVPWVEAVVKGKTYCYNVAHMEGVRFANAT